MAGDQWSQTTHLILVCLMLCLYLVHCRPSACLKSCILHLWIRVNIHGMLLQLLWTRYFMFHTIVDSHVQNINAPLV